MCLRLSLRRRDVSRGDLLEGGGPALLHGELELLAQNGEDGLDPFLPERAKTPDVRTANAGRRGPERDRLEHIGAAPEATVADNRNASTRALHDVRQRHDRRTSRVFGTPTMIRHEQAIDTVFHRECRVFLRHDALEQDLHAGALLEPVDELPSRRALLELRRQRPIPDEVGFAAVVAIVDTPAHPGERRPPEVALDAVARVASGLAHHRLAIAAAEQVHGERDRRCPRAFGALHHLLRERPIGLMI